MRDSVIIYRSFFEAIDELPVKDQAKAYKALFEYSLNMKEIELNGMPRTIFKLMKPQLDANYKRYTNGKRGGRPAETEITEEEPNDNQNLTKPITKEEPKPNQTVTETEPNKNVNDNENVNENKNNRANAPVSESAKDVYKKLLKDLNGQEEKTVWIGFRDFINEYKPDFIEPYQEAYNLIAKKYRLPGFEVINDARKRKLKTRVQEKSFDFIKILEKIRKSDRLLGKDTNSSWKVSFDWIIENQTNYVKILEGNYDN